MVEAQVSGRRVSGISRSRGSEKRQGPSRRIFNRRQVAVPGAIRRRAEASKLHSPDKPQKSFDKVPGQRKPISFREFQKLASQPFMEDIQEGLEQAGVFKDIKPQVLEKLQARVENDIANGEVPDLEGHIMDLLPSKEASRFLAKLSLATTQAVTDSPRASGELKEQLVTLPA